MYRIGITKNRINIVKYKNRVYPMVLLGDINKENNTCDMLILGTTIKLVINFNIVNLEYISYLQLNIFRDLQFYMNDISNLLVKYGKTKENVYRINKHLCKDMKAGILSMMIFSKSLCKGNIDINTRYNTLVGLSGEFLSTYINKVERKVIISTIEDGLGKLSLNSIIHSKVEIGNLIRKYDFYFASMSTKGNLIGGLNQGTFISKKGEDIGYHFTNVDSSQLGVVIYDEVAACITDDDGNVKEINYNWSKLKGGTDFVAFDSLELFDLDCDDPSSIDDLFGNVGNTIILADLIYALNVYEKGIELDFKVCYFLAILGIRNSIVNNKYYLD